MKNFKKTSHIAFIENEECPIWFLLGGFSCFCYETPKYGFVRPLLMGGYTQIQVLENEIKDLNSPKLDLNVKILDDCTADFQTAVENYRFETDVNNFGNLNFEVEICQFDGDLLHAGDLKYMKETCETEKFLTQLLEKYGAEISVPFMLKANGKYLSNRCGSSRENRTRPAIFNATKGYEKEIVVPNTGMGALTDYWVSATFKVKPGCVY